MKQNSTKSLKWLTGVILVFGLISLILLTVQTLGLFFNIPQTAKAVWIDGVKGLQLGLVIFRYIGGVALFAFIFIFMIDSLKAMNNGVLFLRKNVCTLFCSAAAAFVFFFCHTNFPLIMGVRIFQIGLEEIIVPAIICTFAILYRKAVQISEENSLTI